MASAYDDELWRLIPEERTEPPKHLVDFVGQIGEVGAALDIGCGDGAVTAHLRAAELVAADVSQVALARARPRLTGATLVELDPDDRLPFLDNSFDEVLCTETIEHVRDVQLFFSEARRVLRPRGSLWVTTPACGRLCALDALVRGFERRFDPLSSHLRFFTRRSLRALLEEMGFELMMLKRRHGSLLTQARR